MPRSTRKSITYPGVLFEAVCKRLAEFHYKAFSPFAVELVCYDLRIQAAHSVTLPLSRDTQEVQDVVDHLLAAGYRSKQAREGPLVRLLESVCAGEDPALALAPAFAERFCAMSTRSERVFFPLEILPLAERRYAHLGYASLSAYVTGLIRYDLLIGGPHLFSGADCRQDVQEALTRETVRAATAPLSKERKIFLDYLIERSLGKRLGAEQLEAMKARLANSLAALKPPDGKQDPGKANARWAGVI